MKTLKLRAQYFCDDCDTHWFTVWNKPANKTHLAELQDCCPDCTTWGSTASFYPLTIERLKAALNSYPLTIELLKPEKGKAK